MIVTVGHINEGTSGRSDIEFDLQSYDVLPTNILH
jgi:hypothetical protein